MKTIYRRFIRLHNCACALITLISERFCMWVCACVSVGACMHPLIYVRLYVGLSACLSVSLYVWLPVCLYVWLHVCLYVWLTVYVSVCIITILLLRQGTWCFRNDCHLYTYLLPRIIIPWYKSLLDRIFIFSYHYLWIWFQLRNAKQILNL